MGSVSVHRAWRACAAGVARRASAIISFHGTFSYCENKRKRHNETRGAISSCMKLDGFRMSVFPSVLTVRVRPASFSLSVSPSDLTVRLRPARNALNSTKNSTNRIQQSIQKRIQQ